MNQHKYPMKIVAGIVLFLCVLKPICADVLLSSPEMITANGDEDYFLQGDVQELLPEIAQELLG